MKNKESGFESDCYLVKMDCENGEWDILENMSRELALKVGFVFGEWHDQNYRRIINMCQKCFPHLYNSTHIGWGCGNFWAVPKINGGSDYFADNLSLQSCNTFAYNKVNELQQKIRHFELEMVCPVRKKGFFNGIKYLMYCFLCKVIRKFGYTLFLSRS
jgi:hypothetical protein